MRVCVCVCVCVCVRVKIQRTIEPFPYSGTTSEMKYYIFVGGANTKVACDRSERGQEGDRASFFMCLV